MSGVLVVIPTTAGPLAIRSLKHRPGLPASAAFADGDYRPLPWSADYAKLVAPGGPLAPLIGPDGGPYELRLSGSFDAGRSWEAPVCLAHLLASRGREVRSDEGIDLIVWATGAVDLDLSLIPGDYALADKLERSRSLLDAHPDADLLVLLPEGAGLADATAMVTALPRARRPKVLAGGTILAAMAALDGGVTNHRTPGGIRKVGWRIAAVIGGAAGVAGVALLVLDRSPPVAEPSPVVVEPTPLATAATASPELPVIVDEVRARAGSSCRRVVFGADTPETRAVPAGTASSLRPSRLDDTLCGLAFRPRLPNTAVRVDPDLVAASLPPVTANGTETYFFRTEGRRKRVYALQVEFAGGSTRVTHALVP